MQVKLRFFANVREQLGTSQEQVVMPEAVRTVDDVCRWPAQRGPVWGETLAESRTLHVTVDHQIVPVDTTVRGSCEVAFLPPMTGG